MTKFFSKSSEWNDETGAKKGLPRPYVSFPKQFLTKNGKLYLHKKVPMPWQSKPRFDKGGLDLILENESRVFPEGLCGYCGVKFNDNDQVIRWLNGSGPVHSDMHPLHLECMKQGRTFCPFMRTTSDDEFETGTYLEIRAKAEADKNKKAPPKGGASCPPQGFKS
jgi:hypothetical protein